MVTKFNSPNSGASSAAKAKLLEDPKNAKFEVYYFKVAGNGITSRDILAYAGVQWKNAFAESWPQEKANTPFGVLPLLRIEGENGDKVELSESSVIDTYLAKQFGLMGDNAWEEQYIRMLYSSTSCLIDRVSSRYTWNFESGKAENLQFLQKSILPNWIESHEAYLLENGNNGHYIGDKLTLADIRTASALTHWSHLSDPEIIFSLIKPDSPLWKVKETVDKEPRIKAWHDSEEYKALEAGSRFLYKNVKATLAN
ncbi:hypothetical protein BGW42_002837 [Actinomortierella wolfii]|nr:hypothetical protein BGW42_002837 [Actinomortierella wolfii]